MRIEWWRWQGVPPTEFEMIQAWKQWEGYVVDGRFTLGEFQGSSDHSAVFLTNYGPHSQFAAIKFVEANPAKAQLQLSRWERAAALSHRHLIRVLHWGRCQLGDVPMLYVVTEFADENLAQILPGRALTPSEAEFMLRSLLEVLAYLHSAGLAYSRLKPSNVMAVGDDLRLSGDTVCAAGEKNTGAREPTVYDAPELAATGPSPAGDIWSLGVTLVEALTQRPSPGQAVRQTEPDLPETMPAPFLEIARQCLRLDPQRRWSVSDIAAHLLPSTAPPKKSAARSRYVLAGLVVGVLAALWAGPKILRQGPNSTPLQTPAPVKAPETPPPAHEPVSAEDHTSEIAARKAADAAHTDAMPSKAMPRANPPSAQPSVSSSAASAPGKVAAQVLPTVSQRSLNTITGKVRVGVRLSVDSAGRVVDATLASPGPSHYFANAALEASRRWKFTPPEVDGEATPSEWILRFVFGRGGVEVHPEQVRSRSLVSSEKSAR